MSEWRVKAHVLAGPAILEMFTATVEGDTPDDALGAFLSAHRSLYSVEVHAASSDIVDMFSRPPLASWKSDLAKFHDTLP